MDQKLDRLLPAVEVRRLVNDASRFLTEVGISPETLPTEHRLFRVYTAAATDLARHEADGAWERLADTIELGHTVRILRYWRGHTWMVINALKDSRNYRHDLTLLAAAKYLADAGNHLLPVSATAGQRPEFTVRVGDADGALEHKAPETLEEPLELTDRQVQNVIADMRRKAAGQIGGGAFALLSLGGLRVPAGMLHRLCQAADEVFRAEHDDLRNVAALLVFSVGLAIRDLPGLLPGTYGDRHPDAGPHARFASEVDPARYAGIVACRYAANPHYRGHVPIVTNRGNENGVLLPTRESVK